MTLGTWILIGTIVGLVLALLLLLLIRGWNSIGTGVAVLIPDQNADPAFQTYFPDLVGEKPRLLSPKELSQFSSMDLDDFNSHLKRKLGSKDCKAAVLSLLVRDRTKTPALLPVDIDIEKELLTIYRDATTPDSEKAVLAEKVRSRLQNTPDLHDRTTVYSVEKGRTKYHYFPRIQLEFSSRLQSPSQLDRLAYLGMVVMVKGDTPVRFVDYQPKAADIVEFTRGQLTLENQFQAKAAGAGEQGISTTNKSSNESNLTGKRTSGLEATDARKTLLSPELTFTISESFLNELKDSIEARTSGIFNDGKVFFADFRAIKEKRISGTYSFDVMMEIPSKIDNREGGIYLSEPEAREVLADAYLVAVVRHVVEPGFTGWLTQVPEPSNDKVFHQVITQKKENIRLWMFAGVSWGGTRMRQLPSEFTVKVITNRDDGSFVVKSIESKSILGRGSGKIAEIKFSCTQKVELQVEFLDVIVFDQGKSFVLKAPPSSLFTVEANQGGEYSVVGNYNPEPKGRSQQ